MSVQLAQTKIVSASRGIFFGSVHGGECRISTDLYVVWEASSNVASNLHPPSSLNLWQL